MLLNRYKFLSFLLIFIFSSWIWFTCDIIGGAYLFLLVFLFFILTYFVKYKKQFKIPIIYKNIINIKIFFLLIILFIINLVITIFTGNDSYLIYIKILLYILLPLLFFFSYNQFYLYDNYIKLIIKLIIFISFFWQLVFSFIIGHYDSHIGKIHTNSPYFHFSSNELSIFMTFSIAILGMIYFTYYNRKKLLLFFVLFLPFLHFSKSHIGFYSLSLLIGYVLYKKKFVYLFTNIFIIFVLSYLLYIYYNELYSFINNEQIKRFLLANKIIIDSIIGNTNFNIWDFITKVGDGSRTKYFYTYFEHLDKTFWLGMGDKADIILLNGSDYHNMYFFFHIQFSFFAALLWYLILIYFLYLGMYKWKISNYFLIVSVLYWIFRSLFATMNPYIFILYLMFLVIIEANLQKRIIYNE